VAEALDIARNRRESKWSRGELIARMAWGIAHLAFRASPRVLWGFRRGLLRLFGAHVGHNARIDPSAVVWMPWNISIGDDTGIGERVILYALGAMTIGRSVTISQGAHLCGGSHDHRQRHMPLLKCTIDIGNGAWVCADAFVGPSVVVEDFAIVSARAVVMTDVPAWTIVAGNPAAVVGRRAPFCES
jgi:putative colanic acid biosynthesis acetyltransferase WcaF